MPADPTEFSFGCGARLPLFGFLLTFVCSEAHSHEGEHVARMKHEGQDVEIRWKPQNVEPTTEAK